MLGAPKCYSYTARGKCVPGEIKSVFEKIPFAVATANNYQELPFSLVASILLQ